MHLRYHKLKASRPSFLVLVTAAWLLCPFARGRAQSQPGGPGQVPPKPGQEASGEAPNQPAGVESWDRVPESPSLAPETLRYYDAAPTVVDRPFGELIHDIPELKGLEPAASQDELPGILQRVGENVRRFFADYPNTTSQEEVTQEWDYAGGMFLENRIRKFRYLALMHPGRGGKVMEEYRTDKKGRPVEQSGHEGGALITKGFTSVIVHLDLAEQPLSRFRFLGREKVHGRQTIVLGFAQRPESARMVGKFTAGEQSAILLSQGVAWVDPEDYSVLQIRIDLLAPPPNLMLRRQTTEIQFADVWFKGAARAIPLPRNVTVTVNFGGNILRNRHRYSRFELFNVEVRTRTAENSSP